MLLHYYYVHFKVTIKIDVCIDMVRSWIAGRRQFSPVALLKIALAIPGFLEDLVCNILLWHEILFRHQQQWQRRSSIQVATNPFWWQEHHHPPSQKYNGLKANSLLTLQMPSEILILLNCAHIANSVLRTKVQRRLKFILGGKTIKLLQKYMITDLIKSVIFPPAFNVTSPRRAAQDFAIQEL